MSEPGPDPAPADVDGSARGRRRLPGGARGDAIAVLGTSLALGLLGGVLWWLLTEPAMFTVGEKGSLGMKYTDRTPALVARTVPAHHPKTAAARVGGAARRILNALMRSLATPHV